MVYGLLTCSPGIRAANGQLVVKMLDARFGASEVPLGHVEAPFVIEHIDYGNGKITIERTKYSDTMYTYESSNQLAKLYQERDESNKKNAADLLARLKSTIDVASESELNLTKADWDELRRPPSALAPHPHHAHVQPAVNHPLPAQGSVHDGSTDYTYTHPHHVQPAVNHPVPAQRAVHNGTPIYTYTHPHAHYQTSGRNGILPPKLQAHEGSTVSPVIPTFRLL